MTVSQRQLSAIDMFAPPSGEGHSDELFAFPLSPEQERMWEADRRAPGTSAYNAAYRWNLHGSVDAAVLERTFNEIVRRLEILRARFALMDGAPRLIVAEALHLRISITDLRVVSSDERDAAMDSICEGEARRGFDLST